MCLRERKLTEPSHSSFITLLLEGHTLTQAADELGLHCSTCWRWLQRPEVRTELRRQREERMAAVREELAATALEATRYLRFLVQDDEQSPSVRLRAACAVLDRAGVGKAKKPAREGLETWPSEEKRVAFLAGID